MDNKVININSIFRNNNLYPKSTNFKLELNETIKNIAYMRITSIEIPDINYNFSDYRNNNSFTITTGGVNVDTINIGSGNFTSDIIVNTVQDLLDDINTARGTSLAFSIDVVSGKFNFTNTTSFTLDFSRTGNTQYKGINYYFGFQNETYTGTDITADSVLNLNPIGYFFLRLNNIDNIMDCKVNNAFMKVLTNVDKFNYIFQGKDDFNSKDKVFRSPIDLSSVEVQLVDYLGNELEFNEFDFSFTIEIGYIYDKKLYEEINNKGLPNGDTRNKFYY